MAPPGKIPDSTGLLPDAAGMKIGIVVSEWNKDITESLFAAAREVLIKARIHESDIIRTTVPGSFELPLGAKLLIETFNPDAVICIGCVIQGETRHFEFICQAVSQGIMQLNIEFSLPVIFGVLTTNDIRQAQDRSGGSMGNKGIEAAVTALRMIELKRKNKTFSGD